MTSTNRTATGTKTLYAIHTNLTPTPSPRSWQLRWLDPAVWKPIPAEPCVVQRGKLGLGHAAVLLSKSAQLSTKTQMTLGEPMYSQSTHTAHHHWHWRGGVVDDTAEHDYSGIPQTTSENIKYIGGRSRNITRGKCVCVGGGGGEGGEGGCTIICSTMLNVLCASTREIFSTSIFSCQELGLSCNFHCLATTFRFCVIILRLCTAWWLCDHYAWY